MTACQSMRKLVEAWLSILYCICALAQTFWFRQPWVSVVVSQDQINWIERISSYLTNLLKDLK